MQPLTSAEWSYTEYAKLPSQVKDTPEGLKEAARQFESLFINMWLKSAREANAVMAEGSFLSSAEMNMQQEMFDAQMSMHLAKEGGIGLAPTIIRQLGGEVEKPMQSSERNIFLSAPQAPHLDAANQVENPRTAVAPAAASAAVTQQGSRAQMFEDAREFLQTISPYVQRVAGAAGLPPLTVLAQAALETGWGSAVIQNGEGKSSHNLFGIKGTNWSGPTVDIHSKEHQLGRWMDRLDSFRAYPDWESSISDYTRLITGSRRYAAAAEQGMGATEYADYLQSQGYATDPGYAGKLKDLIQRISGMGF